MNLDFTSLKKGIKSLESAVSVYNKELGNSCGKSDLMRTLQAGVIQNFEFVYELCWKFMKRWLDENIGSTVTDGVTRRELFRLSAESRLINKVDEWMEFHKARNLTSHIYDEEIADDVLEYAVKILEYAEALLVSLEERNE